MENETSFENVQNEFINKENPMANAEESINDNEINKIDLNKQLNTDNNIKEHHNIESKSNQNISKEIISNSNEINNDLNINKINNSQTKTEFVNTNLKNINNINNIKQSEPKTINNNLITPVNQYFDIENNEKENNQFNN